MGYNPFVVHLVTMRWFLLCYLLWLWFKFRVMTALRPFLPGWSMNANTETVYLHCRFFFTVLQVLVSISYLTLINAETASSDKKLLIYVHAIIASKTSIDRCGLSVSTVLHPEYCFNKHLLMTYREQPLPRKPIKNVRKAKTKTTITNIRSLHHLLLSPTQPPIWASILTR